MTNGSLKRRWAPLAVGLAILLGALAGPLLAQTQAAKPANCHAYKLDEKTNQILFNDPRVTVQMPEKKERDRLRSQGTPAQVFLMNGEKSERIQTISRLQCSRARDRTE